MEWQFLGCCSEPASSPIVILPMYLCLALRCGAETQEGAFAARQSGAELPGLVTTHSCGEDRPTHHGWLYSPIISTFRMRTKLSIFALVAVLSGSCIAALALVPAEDQSATLAISAPSPNTVIVGSKVSFPLTATGGFSPYSWHLAGGQLPPGLKLHAHSGVISGVATTPGEYHFTATVADSSVPQLQTKCDLTMIVIAGLTIDWKQYPKVQDNTISGSVVVSNQTEHALDLTVVVVAVNTIGRATALGYQHFTIAAQQSGQVIPFGSSPGLGTYFVRADAVGHRPGKERVYRANKQTTASIEVTQF